MHITSAREVSIRLKVSANTEIMLSPIVNDLNSSLIAVSIQPQKKEQV